MVGGEGTRKGPEDMSLYDTNFLQTLEGGHTGLPRLAWETQRHWRQKTPLQALAALLHPVGGKHALT